MKILAFVVTVLGCLSLVGCNEYSAQVCTENLRVDVPALAGSHEFVAQDPKTFLLRSDSISLERTGKGTYANADGSKAFTCELTQGVYYFETQEEEKGNFGAYTLFKNDHGFVFTLMAFDRAKLDEAKIPYTIVDAKLRAPRSVLNWLIPQQGTPQQKMVVDTTRFANPGQLMQVLTPISVSYRLY